MTKRRFEKPILFKPAQWPRAVVLNTTGDPTAEFDAYAEAFRWAATSLADSLPATAVGRRDFNTCPVIFLYRHALELYTKAVVLEGAKWLQLRGESPMEHRKLFDTHRLMDLLPEVKRVFEAVGWDFDYQEDGLRTWNDLEAILAEFDKVDPSSSTFRYPVTRQGTPTLAPSFTFLLDSFRARLDPLLEALDTAVFGLVNQWSIVQDAMNAQRQAGL